MSYTLVEFIQDAKCVAEELKHIEGIIDAGCELSSVPNETGAIDSAERIIQFLTNIEYIKLF